MMADELFRCQPNVLCDLAEQNRREIAACVIRNLRTTAIRVAKLHVGTALSNQGESEDLQNADNLAGFEHGQPRHDQAAKVML